MSVQRLVVGTRFKWKGITYEIKRVLPEGKVNIEDLYSGAVMVVEVQVLVNALFAGELVIEPKLEQTTKKVAGIALDDYADDLVTIARFRREILDPLLKVAASERSKAMAQVCADKAGVDVVTIYRWIEAYEGSGNDLRALIPGFRERGGRASRG